MAGTPERDRLVRTRPNLARPCLLLGALAAVAGSSACAAGRARDAARPPATRVHSNAPEVPSRPGDFTPPPPLEAPPPPARDQPGRAYLERIHPRLEPTWRGFLEDCRVRLPPDHALNQVALETRLALTIDPDGALQHLVHATRSGSTDFDQAALEVVRDAAPFAPPPADLLSDDGRVHITWLFARDRRQAGVATAVLERVEWPVARAVAGFLAAGDVTRAARRLARVAGARAEDDAAELVGLGRDVAAAAIREALASEDAAISGLARDAVAGLEAAAPRPAGDAAAALPVPADVSAEMPGDVPRLAALVTDEQAGRDARVAACAGLGAAVQPGGLAVGARALRAGLSDGDAAIRAGCARAVAAAAARGVRGRALYWRAVELLRDPDEHVRAAAVRAAARLDARRFEGELFVLRREASPLVLVALAEVLVEVSGPLALARLLGLGNSEDVAVRRQAVSSLARHAEPRARAAAAARLADADVQVRLAAMAAVSDEAVLEDALRDPAPEVAQAAFAALVRLRGQARTLAAAAAAIAEASPRSAARVRWARSWLLP